MNGRRAEKIEQLSNADDQRSFIELLDTLERLVDRIDVFEGQWQQVVEGAAVCGLPVEITKGQALAVFHRQEGRCALTGLPIRFHGQGRQAEWIASSDAILDRIDTRRGYVLDNVWWLHRDTSRMKLNIPLARLLRLCRLIADREGEVEIPASQVPTTGSTARIRPSRPEPTVALYLHDRVANDPLHSETSAALWQSFLDWCSITDAQPCTRKAFGLALRSHGYRNKRGHIVWWGGLRLLPCEGARVAR